MRAADAAIAWLPVAWTRWAMRGIGSMFYLVAARQRRTALDNLEHLHPGPAGEAHRRRIARASFAHLGHLLHDLLRLGRMSADDLVAGTEVQGWEHLEAAHRKGRGVIIFSAHFGNWERVALVQGQRGRRIHLVVRPLDNPRLNDFMNRIRTRFGNRVIMKAGAIRRSIRALRAGDTVGMVIDQRARDWDAVRVKFFGQSTAATRSLARLALRHRIPVVPVFGLPLPGGGWRVMYEPEVTAPETGSPEEQIREFTQSCTDWIERYVRRHPEYWFWLHRRWRPADRLPTPERATRAPVLPAASPKS